MMLSQRINLFWSYVLLLLNGAFATPTVTLSEASLPPIPTFQPNEVTLSYPPEGVTFVVPQTNPTMYLLYQTRTAHESHNILSARAIGQAAESARSDIDYLIEHDPQRAQGRFDFHERGPVGGKFQYGGVGFWFTNAMTRTNINYGDAATALGGMGLAVVTMGYREEALIVISRNRGAVNVTLAACTMYSSAAAADQNPPVDVS